MMEIIFKEGLCLPNFGVAAQLVLSRKYVFT